MNTKEFSDNTEEPMTIINETEENVMHALQYGYEDLEDQQEQQFTENSTLSKKKKRRRDTMKREYSEDMLTSAINDLKSGQTLIEASTRHNIPRSTLYMRAKALGVQLTATRNEYPIECMKAAINAVIGWYLLHAYQCNKCSTVSSINRSQSK